MEESWRRPGSFVFKNKLNSIFEGDAREASFMDLTFSSPGEEEEQEDQEEQEEEEEQPTVISAT